jgi:hypothetical protein
MSTVCTIGSVCIKEELANDKIWTCACVKCEKEENE